MNEKVGWLGIGTMGYQFINRLCVQNEVHAWNRSRKEFDFFNNKNVIIHEDLKEIYSEVEIIFICIAGDYEVYKKLLFSNKDILYGKTIIDLSTIDSLLAIKLSEELKSLGINYVEAPVSGGPEGIINNTITTIVFCEKNYYIVEKMLNQVASNIIFLDRSGMPQAIKMLNNLLESIHLVAASEIVSISKKLNIKMNDLYRSIKSMRGDSVYFRVLLLRLLKDKKITEISATLDTRVKDLLLLNSYVNYDEHEILNECLKKFLQAKDKFGGNVDQTSVFNIVNYLEEG